jgi:glutamine amidotransferase
MGNLGSLANMLKHLGVPAAIVSDPDVIAGAQRLILPGVGAFDAAMSRIAAVTGLREVLEVKAHRERIPVLGVCLGMQLLTGGSDEGVLPGLGWIAGRTHRFPKGEGIKVPHMGWNDVTAARENPLFRGLQADARFYFLHSFYFECHRPEDSIATSRYGGDFSCAVNAGNIYGVQFHPEKSHSFGTTLLKNFALL